MYTKPFKTLIAQYSDAVIEFPNLKAVSLAMWLLESGRGASGLARDHLNFAGMKYRPELSDICTRVRYQAHDGQGYYCAFPDLDSFVAGYWRFLDRPPYLGWRDKAGDDLAFLAHIAGIWAQDPQYGDKVAGLLTEARILLGIADSTAVPSGQAMLMPGRPRLSLSEDGKIAQGIDGLDILYRGDDSCPYGKTATRNRRPFEGIVLHHTSPKHSTQWYVQYQIDGDLARGGHFGYHFYVAPSGVIYQGAPLSKRTNQVSPKPQVRRQTGAFLQNVNAIGITCAQAATDSGFSPTPSQETQVKSLAFALCDALDIPFAHVFGHGELQTNRHQSEGRSLAQDIRAWGAADA